MATKDWKKSRELKNFIQFDNDKTNNSIYLKHEKFIEYHTKIDHWKIFDFKGIFFKRFKTKAQALAYAKKYMRKN